MNPLLQAALSHYIADRDKAIAELDVYLNRAAGIGEHAKVVDEVISLFAKLDTANGIIETINFVVKNNNENQQNVQTLKKMVEEAAQNLTNQNNLDTQ